MHVFRASPLPHTVTMSNSSFGFRRARAHKFVPGAIELFYKYYGRFSFRLSPNDHISSHEGTTDKILVLEVGILKFNSYIEIKEKSNCAAFPGKAHFGK